MDTTEKPYFEVAFNFTFGGFQISKIEIYYMIY